MALAAADYLAQLQAELPQGPAWNRSPELFLSRLLDGWAQEFARVDAKINALPDENDPRTTTELLTDWERVAGLPSPCLAGVSQTIAQRRAALHTKVTRLGGQSRQFFIDLAASLGYTVTITEFRPWTVDSFVDEPLYDQAWAHAWKVTAPLNTVTYFKVDSGVDEPLASWGNELLECTFNLVKPAHTFLIFAYV